MTDPNERRRIVWGPIEHANLDPFVVDRSGQVFRADTGKRKKALTQHKAAKSWNQTNRRTVVCRFRVLTAFLSGVKEA
jgi:hypothetical protein